MNQPFEVNFDFALDDSDFIISIRATAKKDQAGNYHVSDFHKNDQNGSGTSIFPAIQIKRIFKGDGLMWVHSDSEMETQLSRAIGKSIELIKNLTAIPGS